MPIQFDRRDIVQRVGDIRLFPIASPYDYWPPGWAKRSRNHSARSS